MTRPLRISIHALGGQGGGVLADWVVNMAEHEGWTAQSTSVPGVAQRTGATLYYVELAPPSDRQSVLALMPTPGDVDIVIAAELMEAGRAIARGLVTPERTVLIASSHRVFAIAEKSAMGDGVISPAKVLDAAERCSKRLILADFAAIAEQCGSVVSASLFGALAASGAMPFEREAFEDAVRRSGRGVERSLAAFEQAFSSRTVDMPAKTAPLPASAEALTRLGTERLTDFQDRAYADLYLMRIGAIATADAQLGGHVEGHALTAAAARHLALWMSYEDAIRVADLKTRPERHERVRTEALAGRETVVHITEFMHPRIEEIADILPRRLGEWLLTRRWGEGWLTRARFVTTTRLSGFMLLWVLARFRRLRPRSYRYAVEQARIEAWLESAVNAARTDYPLGVEVLKLQRLVKGYGDTHARGWRSFGTIMSLLPRLQGAPDAASQVAALHEAALQDDEGLELGRAIRTIERRTGATLAAPMEIVI